MTNITNYFGGVPSELILINKNNEKTSDVSGSTGSSGASGASGASGFHIENLDVTEVINLFKRGDLTPKQMDEWINLHTKMHQITESTKSDNGKSITYTFIYNNFKYSVSCDKAAAASDTDNIRQRLYTKINLKNYKLTEEDINKYFIVAYSFNGMIEQYALNPQFGFKTIGELKAYIETEKTKAPTLDEQKTEKLQVLEEFKNKADELKIKAHRLISEGLNWDDICWELYDEQRKLLGEFDDFIETLSISIDMYNECKETQKEICNALMDYAPGYGYENPDVDSFEILDFIHTGKSTINGINYIAESTKFSPIPNFDSNMTIGDIVSIAEKEGYSDLQQTKLGLWVISHDEEFKTKTNNLPPIQANAINGIRTTLKNLIKDNPMECVYAYGVNTTGNHISMRNALGNYIPKIEDLLMNIVESLSDSNTTGAQQYMAQLSSTIKDMEDNMGWKLDGNENTGGIITNATGNTAPGSSDGNKPDANQNSVLSEALRQLKTALYI